jgi:CelD/BcsL family acetyltransferase involved in cellulose biosynthesis
MVRSIPQLEALGDDWNALARRLRTPVLDHDWFLSCAEAFYMNRDLSIVTARERGVLTGVAPLVLEPTTSGPKLMQIGAAKLYEPGGWLFDSPDALGELVASTVAAGRPLLLQRVPAESGVCQAFARISRRRALTASKLGRPSLGVHSRQPWERYASTLPAHLSDNLRRWHRKAERRIGPVQYSCESPAVSDVDALLERFAAVEASGWKGRHGSALQVRCDLRDFFRRYARRAAAGGRLRIATLSFGSTVAAMEISVEAYDRMWQLKIGYQDALSTYYPGLQLTLGSIRHAFERGLESYEFLGSAAPWQERWKPEPRLYHLLTSYPMTLPGIRALGRDAVAALGRRLTSSPSNGQPRSTTLATPSVSTEAAC